MGAVRLVQEDQAVVGRESGVNRPSPWSATIGAKQEARTHLVHGRGDDGWLKRVSRPRLRTVHSAAQHMDRERSLSLEPGCCSVRDPEKIVRNRLQDSVLGRLELFGQLPCAFVGLVHDDPPVHHKEDAARSRDRLVHPQAVCLGGQSEHGDIDAGCLAGCGRQGDCVGPSARSLANAIPFRFVSVRAGSHPEHAVRQRGLPRKGALVVTPAGCEERCEVGCVHCRLDSPLRASRGPPASRDCQRNHRAAWISVAALILVRCPEPQPSRQASPRAAARRTLLPDRPRHAGQRRAATGDWRPWRGR